MTRLFTACLGTETNSFSPIPTGMSVFQQTMLVRGGQHGDRPGLFGVPLLRWWDGQLWVYGAILAGVLVWASASPPGPLSFTGEGESTKQTKTLSMTMERVGAFSAGVRCLCSLVGCLHAVHTRPRVSDPLHTQPTDPPP